MDKEQNRYELIVFTTFDSSLFSNQNESYQLNRAIAKLQQRNIPLIAVTHKTQAEKEDLQSIFSFKFPLVVEYGSAVLIPQDCKSFVLSETIVEGEYNVKQLGCTYIEARAALKVIQSIVRINNFRGFGDLSETEINSVTGLSLRAIKQAKSRNFSEIFLTPEDVNPEEIIATAEEFGFQVLIEGSLSCLLGAGASVKKAISWLKDSYCLSEPNKQIVTVGLGYSHHDLEMLQAVDIPILIAPQPDLKLDLVKQEWRTKTKGLSGWIEAINTVDTICEEYRKLYF